MTVELEDKITQPLNEEQTIKRSGKRNSKNKNRESQREGRLIPGDVKMHRPKRYSFGKSVDKYRKKREYRGIVVLIYKKRSQSQCENYSLEIIVPIALPIEKMEEVLFPPSDSQSEGDFGSSYKPSDDDNEVDKKVDTCDFESTTELSF
ncbi:hypothetical protein FQA39_LY01549 [Lamprigera yunnana]|nr:hypothetical protein FQA39_LY01549 [Lamprigera yunnana]